jgi:hypothetical protein
MALAAGGQAVDAGAGGVGLAAGLDRLATGQVQLGELRGLERIDVARQFIAIARAAIAVLVLLTALAVALTLAFGARTTGLLRAVLTLTLAFAVTA